MRPDSIEDPPPPLQAEWMRHARVTLPCALAWRAIAEIARRHHAQWDIAIEQFHPGASMAGAFALSLQGKENPRDRKLVVFNVGGPSGTWSVGAGGQPEGGLSDLFAPEPARVIDRIQCAAGLPPAPVPVPASGQQVLGMRLTACVLESLVFWRSPWRATLGGYWYNGDSVRADWVRWLGSELGGPASQQDPEALDRLNECILVHQSEAGCPVMKQSAIKGAALTIDLRTGVVGRIDARTWKKVQQLGVSNGFARGAIRNLGTDLTRQLGKG